MRPRAEIHALFVERFAEPARRVPPTAADLDLVERALSARFPSSYREFVLRHGCVYTPRLDEHLDVPGRVARRAVQEFTPTDQLIAFDQWNASIPQPLLLFASDSLGDMIGFPKSSSASDDLPVVLFDHEFNEIIELAESFDGLLWAYLHGGAAGK